MKPKVKVRFKNVSKKYNLYKRQSDKLLDLFLSKKRVNDFYALKDISFEVYEGEAIGVIGVNGSGKSTLSNLLAQVVPPTSGSIEINGETSLIAISAGLNNHLSGIENIELKCLMLGFNKNEIDQLIPSIVEFADIGEFINQPVKNYSSGMKSRLGFAISAHTDPDILIIDEALSVGDETFHDKCLNKVNEFKANGKTIFFVSHSISQIRSFTDRTLWINFGQVEKFGRTGAVIANYKDYIKWFNGLDNKEKKKYKAEKLKEQRLQSKQPLSVEITNNDLTSRVSSKRKKTNFISKRKPNWKVSFQILLLTLCMFFSIGYMFSQEGLGLTIFDRFVSNQNVNADEKVNNIKINKVGFINQDNVILYEDKDFLKEKEVLDFSKEIYIKEQIDDIYNVQFENKEGYIKVKTVSMIDSPIGSSQLSIGQIVDIFPERLTDSYLYFLAQLNGDYEVIINKLNGLTSEKTDHAGNRVLEYEYDNITIFFNEEQVAKKILIHQVNEDSSTIENIKDEAQLKSRDEQKYLLRIEGYDLILDLKENKISIEPIN